MKALLTNWRNEPLFPSLFDDDFFGLTPVFKDERGHMPKVDISEKDNKYYVNLEVPGLKQEDIDLEFKDGILTVRSEYQKEEENKDENRKVYRREIRRGSFSRSFEFGDDVDHEAVSADMKDGILSICLPKVIKEEKRKKITINSH